jgi:radical SAM protein with 4Fe4S-binding SPASM domain
MAPKTFLYQINVTRACNLRCAHCYIHSDVKAASGRMPVADFVRIASGIAAHMSATGHGHAEIHVVGGEPTMLGLPWFEAAIPAARAAVEGRGFSTDLILVSNLIAPDALPIARLFDRVNTSWEPDTRFPKAWHENEWKRAAASLREAGVDIGVTTTVTRRVVAAGAASVLGRLCDVEGFKQVHFGFFIPSGDGKDNAAELMPSFAETAGFLVEAADWYMARRDADPGLYVNPPESLLAAIAAGAPLDDIVCPILPGSMDIDWNGDAATCLEAGGARDAAWLGNVLADSVAGVAASVPFRRAVTAAARPRRGCVGCDEHPVCRSACGVLAERWHPDADEDCPGFKRFIKHMRALHAAGARPKYDDYRGKTAC